MEKEGRCKRNGGKLKREKGDVKKGWKMKKARKVENKVMKGRKNKNEIGNEGSLIDEE